MQAQFWLNSRSCFGFTGAAPHTCRVCSVSLAVFAVAQPLANRTAPQPARSFTGAAPHTCRVCSVSLAVFAVAQPLANRTAPQPARSFTGAAPHTAPGVAEIKKLFGEKSFLFGEKAWLRRRSGYRRRLREREPKLFQFRPCARNGNRRQC